MLRLNEKIAEKLAPHYGGRERFEKILQTCARPPKLTTLRANTLYRHSSGSSAAEAVAERLATALPAGFVACARPAGVPDAVSVCWDGPRVGEDVDVPRLTVVVDEGCGEAVLRGADVFAVGVVSASHGVMRGTTVAVICDIDGVLRIGEDPATLLAKGASSSSATAASMLVGIGTACLSRSELVARPCVGGIAVAVSWRACGPQPALNSILSSTPGMALLQNLPSIVAAHCLAPFRPESCVLDMCAAPGGKTTHVAGLMQGSGSLIAVDRSAKRARMVEKLCAEFGVKNATVLAADSTSLHSRFADGSFDAVLLDAPCSGIGLRPRLAERATLEEFEARPSYQLRLLREAHRLLRADGGVLVYSVCTMNPLEGEGVIAQSLSLFPDLHLVKPSFVPNPVPGHGLAGFGLDDAQCHLVMRFTPPAAGESTTHTSEDWPAFFVARLERKVC